MIDEVEQQQLAADPVGSRLKAARESQGMSLDDIAAKTRVPIRHLLHMEKGEWDALPAPTYSVGFARAYATAVGLNASEVGNELRNHLGASRPPPTPLYYEPADPARVPPRSLAMIAGAIALLLVVVYLIWRSAAVDDGEVDQPAVVAATSQPQAGPATTPTPAPPGQAGPATTPTGPVTLTATSDVWLRIHEAGGRKLHETVLKAGERYQVPSTASSPQITTARPSAIQVRIGETDIALLAPRDETLSNVSLLPADLIARLRPAGSPQ